MQDRTQIIGKRGGKKLDVKTLWRLIQNPIYAGVIREKWTDNKPIKAQFPGLVSYELFNAANKGKLVLGEKDGAVFLYDKPPEGKYAIPKGARNADFAYRKIVMCSECEKPLFGSSTRGRGGKYYSAYHCNKRGHYFRVRKEELEQDVTNFLHRIEYDKDHIDELLNAIEIVWNKRNESVVQEEQRIEVRITELRAKAKALVDKIMLVSSEIVIILSANKNSGNLPKLNELFKLKNDASGNMVLRVQFVSNTFWLGLSNLGSHLKGLTILLFYNKSKDFILNAFHE